MIKQNAKKIAVAGLILLCLLLAFFDVLATLDNRAQDKLYQKEGLIDPSIYVIGIDEASIEALGPYNTWSRQIMADLINTLNADPQLAPAVIGVDILYTGQSSKAADAALAQAASFGNVVAAAAATFGARLTGDDDGGYQLDKRAVLAWDIPYPALAEQAKYGFTNVIVDADSVVRHSLHQFDVEDETVYSFAYEIYKAYMQGEADPPLDQNNGWYINYSGKPGDYYNANAVWGDNAGTSVINVLNGQVDPAIFAGSIVLIGPYTSGLLDDYYTPMSSRVKMYGVEIHANIIQALLYEDFKTPVANWAQLLFLLALLLGGVAAFRKLDVRYSAVIVVGFAALYLFAAARLYAAGYILKLLYPIISLTLLYLFYLVFQYVVERLARRKVTNMFKKYVAPQVVESIIDLGVDQLKLGGDKKDIAVLFVDVRGFTPLSESLQPEQVVDIINEYLNLTTTAVFQNGGTLDKFIGDATMAIFNAPLPLDDYIYRAVKTGLDMVDGAAALNDKFLQKYGKSVGFGIGVNCGPAVVGNIGTSVRMDYTAIGDTVNTAARLEANAKAGTVVISEEIVNRLEGRIEVESLGKLQLKGKADGFAAYRVIRLL